jgi:hypothetical protein
MNPFLQRQLLLLENPELMALQQKLDKDTEGMSSYAKCLYIQELMLDNCQQLKTLLQDLQDLTDEGLKVTKR